MSTPPASNDVNIFETMSPEDIAAFFDREHIERERQKKQALEEAQARKTRDDKARKNATQLAQLQLQQQDLSDAIDEVSQRLIDFGALPRPSFVPIQSDTDGYTPPTEIERRRLVNEWKAKQQAIETELHLFQRQLSLVQTQIDRLSPPPRHPSPPSTDIPPPSFTPIYPPTPTKEIRRMPSGVPYFAHSTNDGLPSSSSSVIVRYSDVFKFLAAYRLWCRANVATAEEFARWILVPIGSELAEKISSAEHTDEAISAALIRAVSTAQSQADATDRLMATVQTSSEHLQLYIKRFKDLATAADKKKWLDSAEGINKFARSLYGSLRGHAVLAVTAAMPSSFGDAENRILDIAAAFGTNSATAQPQRSRSRSPPRTRTTPHVPCPRHPGAPHSDESCRLNPAFHRSTLYVGLLSSILRILFSLATSYHIYVSDGAPRSFG